MKKEITTVKYYCDFCGEECKHTPEYIMPETNEEMPETKNIHEYKLLRSSYYRPIRRQKDICPDCEEKIAMLLPLVKNMTIKDNGRTWEMEIKA